MAKNARTPGSGRRKRDRQNVEVAAKGHINPLLPYLSGRSQNASMKLLMLDFMSQRLLEHARWLVGASRDMADEGTIFNSAQPNAASEATSTRGIELLKPSKRVRLLRERYHVMTPLTRLISAAAADGRRMWHLPGLRRRHAHYFLDGYLSSADDLVCGNKKGYFSVYASVERSLMRLFKIKLPVASPPSSDDADHEEKAVEGYSEYIRAAEHAIHELSQKPPFYAHLLFIFIIVLTRNLRRVLRVNQPSIVLVEFTLLCAEAIQLTQKFLHQLCSVFYGNAASRGGVAVERLSNPDDATQECHNPHELLFLKNMKTLMTFNDTCSDYKQALVFLCRTTWRNYGRKVDYEVHMPSSSCSTPTSQGHSQNCHSATSSMDASTSESCDNSFERMSGGPDGRQDGKGSTEYCKVMAEFILKADRLLCQWGVGLCKYAAEANKIMMDPLYVELRAVDSGKVTGGPVVMYKQVEGANLSLHRDPVLNEAIRSDRQLTERNTRRSKRRAIYEEHSGEMSEEEEEGEYVEDLQDESYHVSREESEADSSSDVEPMPTVDDNPGRPETEEASHSVRRSARLVAVAAAATSTASEASTAAVAPTAPPPPPPSTSEAPVNEATTSATNRAGSSGGKSQSNIIPASTRPDVSPVPPDNEGGGGDGEEDNNNNNDNEGDAVSHTDSGPGERDSSTQKQVTKSRRSRKWNREDVAKLVNAINKHGAGKWSYFSYTYFGGEKTGPQLKDKWCNLTRYKHVYQVQVGSGHGTTRKTCWKIADTL